MITPGRDNLWAVVLGLPGRRPATTLTIVGAVVVLAAMFVTQTLRPSTSLQAMLDDQSPAAQAMARVSSQFETIDDLLLLVTVSSAVSEAHASQRLLVFAQRLEKALHNWPQAASLFDRVVYRAGPDPPRFVESVMVRAGLYYLDDAAFESIKQRLMPHQIRNRIQHNEAMIAAPGPAANRLAKYVLKDPLGLHEFLTDQFASLGAQAKAPRGDDAFVSEDGRSLLIRIAGKQPSSDLAFTQQFTAAVRAVVDQTNTDDLVVSYAGGYAIADACARAIRSDMIHSIIVSVVVLQMIFLIMYRRLFSFVMVFMPVSIGILVGFSGYALINPSLTPLAAVTGGVLAGLGIDYGVHYLSHYADQCSAGDASNHAVAGTVVAIGPVIIAACMTSVVGFLAVTQSGVQALRDFAWVGALGLVGTLIATLMVLPAMLVLMNRLTPNLLQMTRVQLAPLINAIGQRRGLSVTASVGLLISAGVVCAIGGSGGWRYEADLAVLHPQPNQPLATQARIGERFGGLTNSMVLHLEASSYDQLVSLAHRVHQRLTSAPAVRLTGIERVYSLAALLPDPARAEDRRHAIQTIDADRVITDFNTSIADSVFEPSQYRDYAGFIKEILTRSEPPGVAALGDFPTLAATVLPKSFQTNPSNGVAETIATIYFHAPLRTHRERAAAIDAVRGALADLPGATLTGMAVIGHDTEHTILENLVRLPLIATGFVVAWLLLYFRRLTDVGLCLCPIVFGLLCLAAYAQLADERLNMVNLIAIPLLIGIGIDDGIFLVSAYRRHRSSHNAPQGLSASLGSSCHAIVTTSVTTAVAFGSLLFTSIPAIRSLGRIMFVGVSACLVGSLFLLTPMLITLVRKRTATAVLS